MEEGRENQGWVGGVGVGVGVAKTDRFLVDGEDDAARLADDVVGGAGGVHGEGAGCEDAVLVAAPGAGQHEDVLVAAMGVERHPGRPAVPE